MDQIFYVNSASFVDVSITSSLLAGAGSNIDLSQATQVSGSFVGTLLGNASTATSSSYAGTASVLLGTITSASYASTASVALTSISASHANVADTATLATTAATASFFHLVPQIKSGKISGSAFGGSPLTSSVIFVTPYPNTNYSVTIIGGDARMWTLEEVSGSGFTVSANSGVALSDYVYWTAMGMGESL
jgi:uncharacterized protein (DUF697 family)